MDIDRLATTLRHRIAGEVVLDPESLSAVSRDFGGIAVAKPRIVVWPTSVDDVVAVVQTARELGLSLSVRGAGHSQGGQSLSNGGIVVRTERLNTIEQFSEDDGTITAGAGTLWSDLVATVIDRNRWPVVMTDNLKVTLAGSLAVAGVGPASFRHGAQIHHCLGVEVVLGTGDVVWLSPEHQARLFHCFLGGLGQFGIVTKVKLRLRSAPSYIHTHILKYDEAGRFLSDAQQLMTRDDVHQLSGYVIPAISPARGSRHDYVLAVAEETEQSLPGGADQITHGLSFNEHSEICRTTREHLARQDERFDQRPMDQSRMHPWVEHFLPVSNVSAYVDAVTAEFPSDWLLAWPMQTEYLRHPMLRLPETESVVLVGIMCSLGRTEIADALPRLKNADRLGAELGGKRYLSGWLDFDEDRWRDHFGDARWDEIVSLKRECDPDRLFRLWSVDGG